MNLYSCTVARLLHMSIIPSVKVRGGSLVYNRVHIHNFQTLYDSVVLVSSAYVQYAIDMLVQ